MTPGITWLGMKKLRRLQVDDQFEIYGGYVMTRDHRHLMLYMNPVYPAALQARMQFF